LIPGWEEVPPFAVGQRASTEQMEAMRRNLLRLAILLDAVARRVAPDVLSQMRLNLEALKEEFDELEP
jgi:hypothetical protein